MLAFSHKNQICDMLISLCFYFSHLVGERMWIAEISTILDLSTRIIRQGKRHEIWRENIW